MCASSPQALWIGKQYDAALVDVSSWEGQSAADDDAGVVGGDAHIAQGLGPLRAQHAAEASHSGHLVRCQGPGQHHGELKCTSACYANVWYKTRSVVVQL